NTNINVSPVNLVTMPDPSGTQRAVAAIQVDPPTTFRIPVALTFPLSVQADPGSQIPILLYRAIYEATEFTAVVDDSGRTATARVTHFSTYAVPFATSRILTVSSLNPASG